MRRPRPRRAASGRDRACRGHALTRAEHVEPELAEHRDQRDQRQADERGRIVAVEPLDERDTETVDLRAARAIVGPVGAEVGLDRRLRERAELDVAGHEARALLAARATLDRDGRQEGDAPAAHRTQLRDRVLVRLRFRQRPPVEHRDLVAADDDRVGMAHGDRVRLLLGEAHGERGWRLAGARRLVDAGAHRLERQPEAREQLAAVRRGRGEDQSWNGHRRRGRARWKRELAP